MPSTTINSFLQRNYYETAPGNGYTVFVPAIVHNLPADDNPGYVTLSAEAQLNAYYVKTEDPLTYGPSTYDEAISYNYVRGLIIAGYTVLFKPLTTETGDLVSRVIDNAAFNNTALGRLYEGTNMDISDLYLYQVDFLTDGGLMENLADSPYPDGLNITKTEVIGPRSSTAVLFETQSSEINKVSEISLSVRNNNTGETVDWELVNDPTEANYVEDTTQTNTSWAIPISGGTIQTSYPNLKVNGYNTGSQAPSGSSPRWALTWWQRPSQSEDGDSFTVEFSGKVYFSSITNTRAGIGAQIYSKLHEIVETRQDCILIPGLYDGCTAEQAPAYLANLLNKNNIAAPYGPKYEIRVGTDYPTKPGTSETYRMDGAYIFLITLANAINAGVDPWMPPAGVNRMIVPNDIRNPEYPVGGAILNTWQGSFTEGSTVTPVNPIMNIPNYGYTVFGQRSMSLDKSASEPNIFKNLTTQLVSAIVHRAIFNVGLSITFDQNVVNTWTKFKTRLGSILQSIESDGGITDYLIIMDETTTTQQDLLANRLNGKVSVAVPSIVESIVIDFYIEPQTVTFVNETETE